MSRSHDKPTRKTPDLWAASTTWLARGLTENQGYQQNQGHVNHVKSQCLGKIYLVPHDWLHPSHDISCHHNFPQFYRLAPNSRYRKGVIAEVPVQEAPCHDLPTIGWSNPEKMDLTNSKTKWTENIVLRRKCCLFFFKWVLRKNTI